MLSSVFSGYFCFYICTRIRAYTISSTIFIILHYRPSTLPTRFCPNSPFFMLSYDPSYRNDRPIRCISIFNPCFRRAGMHDPAAAQIHRHMSRIADDVAGLRLFIRNLSARSPLCAGVARDAVAVLLIHGLDKSGTVRPVRQARSACHIRISHKLAGICRDVASAGSCRGRNCL